MEPLEIKLNEKEKSAEERSNKQQRNGSAAAFANLRRANRHGHGEAADNEHESVYRAPLHFNQMAALREASEVKFAVDRVGGEKAAEEQHFGDEKNPHAQLARALLRGQIREVLFENRPPCLLDRGFRHGRSPSAAWDRRKLLRLRSAFLRNFHAAAAKVFAIRAPLRATDWALLRVRSAWTKSNRQMESDNRCRESSRPRTKLRSATGIAADRSGSAAACPCIRARTAGKTLR